MAPMLKNRYLHVRLTNTQYEQIHYLARRQFMTVSQLLRKVIAAKLKAGAKALRSHSDNQPHTES